MNNIGDRIKQIRTSEGLTQKDFAKRILVSPSYISGVEHGNEVPNEKFMKLVSLEFGISLDWICKGKGEMLNQYYDDSVECSAKTISSAMAEIWELLNSDSNSIYHSIANVLLGVEVTISLSKKMNGEASCDYLEKLANILLDIERAMQIKMNGYPDSTIENHKQGLYEDIEGLLASTENY